VFDFHFGEDAASNSRALAALGFNFIPVRHGEKKAAIKWLEFQHRRPTELEVRDWLKRYDSWAIITGAISGIVVVDCDSQAALDWARDHLPATPLEVLTSDKGEGFRGRHLYYRHPGTRVGNRARIQCGDSKLALDVRGDGGYVLAPGALHPSGVRYQAIGKFCPEVLAETPILPVHLLDAPVAPAQPERRLQPVPSSDDRFRRASAWMAKRDPSVAGMGGNDQAFRTACNLVRGFYLDDDDAMALLADWNMTCQPPWSDDELQTFINNARAYGKDPFGCLLNVPLDRIHEHECAAPAPADEWDPPTPLDDFIPPAFPVEFLPWPFSELVDSLAVATQVPADLPGMMVLSALAACLQRNVEVEARTGWREPLNLYTATILPPANRKSTVVSTITRPLIEWEREQAQLMAEELASAEETKAACLRHLENLRKRGAAIEEIMLARNAYDACTVPHPPKLVADDITPERVASLMAENGERLAILSAEGGIFTTISGRYSNGTPNLDIFLKAHSGDMVKVDRQGKGREPVFLLHPALTFGLAIQPDVIDGLFSTPGFRGRGLLGRFCFVTPTSYVGRRHVDPPPVDWQVLNAYRTAIMGLLNWTKSLTEPCIIRATPEANEALANFERRLEPRLDPVVGDLGDLADWAGKAAGLALRIAGLLEAPEAILRILRNLRLSTEDSIFSSLDLHVDTMERAISIVEDFLVPHASNAFLRMGVDETTEGARLILSWIERTSSERFTKRDLFNGIRQARFSTVETLDAPVEMLISMGYLRAAPQPRREGPGRKPSPLYLANPHLLSQS